MQSMHVSALHHQHAHEPLLQSVCTHELCQQHPDKCALERDVRATCIGVSGKRWLSKGTRARIHCVGAWPTRRASSGIVVAAVTGMCDRQGSCSPCSFSMPSFTQSCLSTKLLAPFHSCSRLQQSLACTPACAASLLHAWRMHAGMTWRMSFCGRFGRT
jgi:hypothetical protein